MYVLIEYNDRLTAEIEQNQFFGNLNDVFDLNVCKMMMIDFFDFCRSIKLVALQVIIK